MSELPGTSLAGKMYAKIIPCLRYRDAPAALSWLCRAFGFERHLVVEGPADTVAHAQLTLENGMIMLGSALDSEYGRLVRQPAEGGGGHTQTIYVVVADVDAHYARAKAAGATVLIDIKDEDYGGRGYSCCDLEGHVWSFGSYDPWAKEL
jgi:uncharacterized glyoxalase superfamily protein PhnB